MFESSKQINLFTKRAASAKRLITPESEIQSAFFVWLKMHEHRFPELKFCFAVPNGGDRFKTTAAAMKRAGVRAGVPDVFLPISRKGFHGLWIEFKTDDGKAPDAQNDFMQFLAAQNYKVLICRT